VDCWNAIKSGDPNPGGSRGLGGTYAYDEFKKSVGDFAALLPGIVASISDEAQRFYDRYFAGGDPAKVTLKLGVTTPPSASGTNQQDFSFTIPVVEFGIQIGGKTVDRPQAFLNEAKLTQLALSVRFAASLVNLHESDLKLLVLDDLLVSLDMSNRMEVVEILLADTFANYQKIILTHELGFFREFRRKIGAGHPEWCFLRLEGNASSAIEARSEKTDIQKAADYLHGHDLDEAAICLRKAAEDTARRYREWADRKSLPPGKFFSLTDNLRAARARLLEQIPASLYEKVLEGTPVAHREHLIPTGDSDLDALAALDVADRGRLKTQRNRLRMVLTDEHWNALENARLIEEVLRATERVLNPSAHAGDPPLYEDEVQKALDLIARLEKCLA
jgi:hypothetical protein